MRDINGAIDYAHAHANDFNWDGDCERFVHRAGAFTQDFPTAYLAGSASGHLDSNPATAQRGELHYWGGVWDAAANRYDGHVAFELGGNVLLMASAAVTTDFGSNLGTITFDDYRRTRGLPYRGHTFRHGAETLASISTTSNGSTPLTPTQTEDDMKIQNFQLGDQDFFYYPDGTLFHSPDAPHTANLQNWYAVNKLGAFNEAQVNILFSGNSNLTFADAFNLVPGSRTKKP